MKRAQVIQFPAEFEFGAATSAYQVEGAFNVDGKGASIWDTFTRKEEAISDRSNGKVACDHYNRFKEDVAEMRKMGLSTYRFSISWSRVLPSGKGQPNKAGLDFYHALINELLANNIKPCVTLYHWDLPQALQDKGGWNNRSTVDAFVAYAAIMFAEYGQKINRWITINEPFVAAFAGHATGQHAPGITHFPTALNVSHHLLLAHALVTKLYHNLNLKGKIGITLNLNAFHAASPSEADQKKTALIDSIACKWFLDPILKGGYPIDLWTMYQTLFQAPNALEEDLESLISTPTDFIGINYYSRKIIQLEDGEQGFDIEAIAKAFGPSNKPGKECTDMGWEVYPEGLLELLLRFKNEYGNPVIYITENGAAYKETANTDGYVDDQNRISYLRRHFEQAAKAIVLGVNLKGYYVWSLLDNFEWSEGYEKTFGLIHVDYKTQKRTWKASAGWYSQLIADQEATNPTLIHTL